MSNKLNKHFGLEIKSKDSKKRQITVIGSSLGVDRDKDIVDIRTMNLKNYKANPVVLWSHRSSELPVAKAVSVMKVSNNTQLKFKLEFADKDTYPFADVVYRLTKAGFINASSIGFAVNYEKSEYDKDRGGYNLNNSELLEISLVNVPANADALITQRSFDKAYEDNIINEKELEWIKAETEEDREADPKEEHNINDIEERLNSIQLSYESLKKEFEDFKKELKQEETLDSYIDELFEDVVGELDQKSKGSLDSTETITDSDLDNILN